MKIFRVKRDFSVSYAEFKKKIKARFINVTLIQSIGNGLYIVFADSERGL